MNDKTQLKSTMYLDRRSFSNFTLADLLKGFPQLSEITITIASAEEDTPRTEVQVSEMVEGIWATNLLPDDLRYQIRRHGRLAALKFGSHDSDIEIHHASAKILTPNCDNKTRRLLRAEFEEGSRNVSQNQWVQDQLMTKLNARLGDLSGD